MKSIIAMLGLLALLSGWCAQAEPTAAPSGAMLAVPNVPSAAAALAAWQEFRADPLARLDRTQPFLDFIRDSGQVHIVLNNALLAWMYQPMNDTYKATLYAAFLGGNMASQLASGQSSENDDVAGMASALDAYAAVRTAHPDFELVLFESLATARSEHRLAAAVKNIANDADAPP